MYRISNELTAVLDGGDTVIVPNRAVAQILRLAHSASQMRAGHKVWRSPEILPWNSWLERLLRDATLAATPLRAHTILSAVQERALWQRVALASDTPAAMALRLQRSAGLARAYRIRLTAQSDNALLLGRAVTQFHAACADDRRVSVALAVDAQLQAAVTRQSGRVVLAGFASLTPQQRWLREQLLARGIECSEVAAAGSAQQAPLRIAAAPDPATEIALCAHWCRSQLEQDPQRRLLVVTHDLDRDRTTVERAFGAMLAPRTTASGPGVGSSSSLRFDRGPSLLHAPHLGVTSSARARLDVWLRTLGRAQFAGNELQHVLQQVPGNLAPAAQWLAHGLRQRDELLGASRLSLRNWAERFGSVVDAYQWPGTGSAQGGAAIAQWREMLGELASLDAVTPDADRESALLLLRDLLRAGEQQTNRDDAPICIAECGDLTNQAPVVTWDGIWVLGMDSSRWPQAARPDALLSLPAQRIANVPEASVSGRMAQARAGLAMWVGAGTDVVLSWARTQGEVHQQRSPLLDDFPAAAIYDTAAAPPSLAQRLATGRTLERIEDGRGTEWSGQATLPGGVKVPEEQGECAFRAYARLRLGAEPMPAATAGIDPRLRGMLLHRCLQLLWSELQDSTALARRTDLQLHQSILAAFDRALQETLQECVLAPDARALERERRRTLAVALDLLTLERARDAFAVRSLEQRETLRVDAAMLRFRIDRVDRLADGSLVVMDYKSGLTEPLTLSGERPRPVQLLAYASALAGEAVTGLALVQLRRPVKFVATADAAGRWPGQRNAPEDWREARERWHAYIEKLVRDFLAGIATVDPQPQACQYCHLPALCRIDALRLQDEPNGESGDE